MTSDIIKHMFDEKCSWNCSKLACLFNFFELSIPDVLQFPFSCQAGNERSKSNHRHRRNGH